MIFSFIKLIFGLAGQMHAQSSKHFFIYRRKKNRGVYLTIFQLGNLRQCQVGILIGGCTDGQCNENFISMQPGIFTAQIIRF